MQRTAESDLRIQPQRRLHSNLTRFAWCESNLFHVPPLENSPRLDAGPPRESLLYTRSLCVAICSMQRRIKSST